jgi:hypothetical protein
MFILYKKLKILKAHLKYKESKLPEIIYCPEKIAVTSRVGVICTSLLVELIKLS